MDIGEEKQKSYIIKMKFIISREVGVKAHMEV